MLSTILRVLRLSIFFFIVIFIVFLLFGTSLGSPDIISFTGFIVVFSVILLEVVFTKL